jgi:hypothetical protein
VGVALGVAVEPLLQGGPEPRELRLFAEGPRGSQPKRFPLKARKMGEAIGCNYRFGPDFGRNSRVSLGETYRNDTSVDGATFLLGSHKFAVTEIKVFEITD